MKPKDHNEREIRRYTNGGGGRGNNNPPPNWSNWRDWVVGIVIAISAFCAYGYHVENCQSLSVEKCIQRAVSDFKKKTTD